MNPLKSAAVKPKSIIEVKAVTWLKDSHGLFDYESKQVSLKKLSLETPTLLLRKEDQIIQEDVVSLKETLGKLSKDEGSQILAHVNTTMAFEGSSSTIPLKKYFIDPIDAEINPTQNEMFLIVRSLKNKEGVQKGCQIGLGDVIKLGRMEYKIIECRLNDSEIKSILDPLDSLSIKPNIEELIKPKRTCRICLGDEENSSEDYIFVNPCKCKGTSEFVHLSCLKQWIKSKVSTKESGCAVFYKMKKLECEVCKEPLPRCIKYGQKSFDIVDIQKPEEGPYMILSFRSKDKKQSSGLYVVQFLKGEGIKLGRGHLCDIRISDISVSRLHAYIKYEDDNFILTDNNSKFGTLVLMQNPYYLTGDKVAIQVGRTVVTFTQKNASDPKKIPAAPCPNVVEKKKKLVTVPIEKGGNNSGELESIGRSNSLQQDLSSERLMHPKNNPKNVFKNMDI